ncbi:MAG: alpha/beta hydrolase [Pseudomonadota bacterium]|nr:alpha/beta hydrolase [Pseudomonadota bacterium]
MVFPALPPSASSRRTFIGAAAFAAAGLAGAAAKNPGAGGRRETFRLSAAGEPDLFLRRQRPDGPKQPAPVLYVHGATFPSALSIAFRFDGYSWMDDLAAAGFSVWGLDFAGYGESARYPETARAEPPGRAGEAARQIERAVAFICEREGAPRASIVAHSWGTLAAGVYAAGRLERLERLVLFGPVARREGPRGDDPSPPFRLVTVDQQHARFVADTPAGHPPVLLDRHFERWGPAYLASDPESATRSPPAVLIPGGPAADLRDAWSGAFPYDPGKITAPTMIVRGEWDSVTADADARWLFEALANADPRRDVKISKGSHLMHLEESRFELYEATRGFLAGATPRR